MKLLIACVLVSCLLICGLLADDKNKEKEGKTVWTFQDDAEGKIAKGFKGESGEWKIVTVEGERVLAQQAKNSSSTFNLVLATDVHAKDVDLGVKMKAVAGEIDQGGGLVWRARDKNNYYLARFNPLEDNFRLYKVQDGKRSQFASTDIKATPGWHTLRVTMKGERIEYFFDGKKQLEHSDSTFKDAGMIGLWSKADAQTYFDDLTLTALE